MESHGFTGVTNIKLDIQYEYTYEVVPGVYGVVGTSTSLADSTGLRAFDRTTTGASIITQEDQCVDEETIHTTQETVYALIVADALAERNANSFAHTFAFVGSHFISHGESYSPAYAFTFIHSHTLSHGESHVSPNIGSHGITN
eukprot:g20787.t1